VAGARRRTQRHGWLKLGGAPGDPTVKPVEYLPVYEDVLGGLRNRRFSLLELGVWKADSLLMWRDAFPKATIVGLDLAPPAVDLGPRVHIVSGDQGDADLLHRTAAAYAPDGFEVIIDDAAHLGAPAARSLQALYGPHLRPGGLYVIEDWATGYRPSWPDGADLDAVVGVVGLDEIVEVPREGREHATQRMRSHDYGMVGLVKRLIDHVAAGTLQTHQPQGVDDPLAIEWMQVSGGMVILKKG
jgi:SAM-dependent methyltransferase